jgi:hypothetical protein
MSKVFTMIVFSMFAVNLMNSIGTSTQIARAHVDPALTMYALR